MGTLSLFVFMLTFCLGKAEFTEFWVKVENQQKSFGCNSIENVTVATSMECAMLFAQRSDVNLADFNVLLYGVRPCDLFVFWSKLNSACNHHVFTFSVNFLSTSVRSVLVTIGIGRMQ